MAAQLPGLSDCESSEEEGRSLAQPTPGESSSPHPARLLHAPDRAGAGSPAEAALEWPAGGSATLPILAEPAGS